MSLHLPEPLLLALPKIVPVKKTTKRLWSPSLSTRCLLESSEEENDDDDDDDDERTSYNPVMAVGYAASDMMCALEDGINKFLEPDLPKKKPKKKEPPKSFFEAGMDYLYAEEPKKSSRNKKKKSKPKNLLEDGMGHFYDYLGANKENNKKKKPMTNTRSKTMSRRRKQKTQNQQQEQAYKLVPAKSLPLSRFRC